MCVPCVSGCVIRVNNQFCAGFDDAATKFLQELDQHPKFGDRIDAVSDYELEMVLPHPAPCLCELLTECIRFSASDKAFT